MAFDAGLAISLSVAGIVITFALVTMVNILKGSLKKKREKVL
jgi:hypothetical protein